MKPLKVFFLMLKGLPYKTQCVIRYNRFIIKKKDKTDYKSHAEYHKCIKQIEKYGNILNPICVKKVDFSGKYVITDNIYGYYALKDSHIFDIPVLVLNA